ncbi:histone deacetylase family protein [Candidatus Contubernalis alkaliaceticus]|uniref:histone deacetylase family protein n=1 Tax=Candidatus Contubernalis alkaliaceticus TaxID=338645 RepID=UPI001F4C3D62|nr:histone deacetylase [Candidatus Contubernalis alkalaceticus]UNC91793.1 histone deacetylase family protein [Candidatus Contubernalis alkalaceticus]
MKVVFHDSFLNTYTRDPAAAYGRLDPTLKAVKEHHTLITPKPCLDEDVLLVHTQNHLEDVKYEEYVYKTALLAVGSTIKASEIAMEGDYSFALCRPPGHHASPDSCWGFCYFNNIAIAVLKLLTEEKINSALIVDFDLHFGDGTSNTFAENEKVNYYHVKGENRTSFVDNLQAYLDKTSAADVVAVSAGFDRHYSDWGHMLYTEDYHTMGFMLGNYARKNSQGRLFAALEGGYNANSLGDGIMAFLRGLEDSKG